MSYYQPQYGAGGQGFSSQAQSLYNAYDQQYGTPQQPSYDSRSSGGPMRSTGDYSSSYRDQPYSRGPSHAHEEFKTLFMGNLPPTVTEQALEQFFSDAGRVIAVRLKRYHDTGKVKGYGFVEFDGPPAAERALQTKNHGLVMGHSIRLEPSYGDYDPHKHGERAGGGRDRDFEDRRGGSGGNFRDDRHDRGFDRDRRGGGRWDDRPPRGGGYGGAGYNDRDGGDRDRGHGGRDRHTGLKTRNVHKEPQREKPPGCRHIFMGNLADEVTEEDVMSLFQTCGPIVAVTWMNDRHSGRFKGCGFVEFADEASTSHAASLNGSEIRGRPMRVDYATIQETRNGERQKGYSGRNTSAAIHSRYRDNSPPRGGGPRSPPRSNYSSDSHSQQQQQQYQGQPQQHQPQQQTQQSATAGGLNAQQQQLLLLATLNPAALQQAGVDPATLAALQQLQQIQQLTGQQPTGSAASIGLSGLGGGGFAGVPTATPSLYGAPAAPQQPAAPNLLQFLQPQQQSQQPQQQSVQHLLQQQMQQSTMQQQQQPLPGLQGLQGLLPGLAGSIQAQPPHQQPSSVPSNTLHPHQHHQQQQQQSGSQSASVAVSNMQFASPDQIKPVSPRPPGCKSVFVGNVHDSVAEPTILQIFAGCGPIERVKWLSDRSTGRFKGSGFIEFRDEASAVKAVNFNGAILAGQVLRVDYAGDRPVFDSQHPPHQQQLGAPSIGGQYDTQPTTSSSGSNATSALSAGLASLLGSGALSSLMTGNQQGIHMQNGSHTGAFNPYQ